MLRDKSFCLGLDKRIQTHGSDVETIVAPDREMVTQRVITVDTKKIDRLDIRILQTFQNKKRILHEFRRIHGSCEVVTCTQCYDPHRGRAECQRIGHFMDRTVTAAGEDDTLGSESLRVCHCQ